MKMRVSFAALLLVLNIFASAPAAARQAGAGEAAAALDRRLGELAAQGRFSGAALVARDGRVLLSKGYGMANYELGVPNTPQTKFRLGSVTKQFTAAAVLLLQERGKLSVQDPVCKYVEDCPAAWQPVTVHHILTHTAGLPNFTSFPEYMASRRTTTTVAETLKRFRDRPLEFAPGERYNYSNSGYVLLGHLVEKLSGKSYADFLRENFFAPAGMKNTGYDRPEEVLPGRASGYARRDGKLYNADFIDMSIPHAAGSLYSTVEDLYLWDQALHGGKLLTPKSVEAMTTPFKNGYAYGLNVGKRLGLARVAHGGGIEGFRTVMERWPEAGATVIVLSNLESSETSVVAAALARGAMPDKLVLPAVARVEPSVLQSYAGRYEVEAMPGFQLDLIVEGDKLFMKPSNQPRHQLAPVSPTEFFDFDEPGEARFAFARDEGGRLTLTVTGMGPRPITARRVK